MNVFKRMFRAILPAGLKKIGQKYVAKYNLKKLYKQDFKRYAKSASLLVPNMDEVNLRARITIGYHGIEKGFCKPNFRFGFGKVAIESLGVNLLEFKNKGYSVEDKRFKTAIGVLEKYREIHNEKPEYLSYAESVLDKVGVLKSEKNAGAKQYEREEIIDNVV